MRKVLLASSAGALVLALSGGVFAGNGGTASPRLPAGTLTPPDAVTAHGLMFAQPGGPAFATPGKIVLSANEEPSAAETPKPATPVSSMTKPSQVDTATPAEPAASPAPVPAAAATPPSAPPTAAAAATTTTTDPAVSAAIKDLVEGKLASFVPKEQDRTGVLAFYKARDFAPMWTEGGKPTPRAQQTMEFLKGVAADGLDPADYPVPQFNESDPAKLAADELRLTASAIAYVRHASIGRTAFSRVSGAVYFDQKAPNANEVLAKLAEASDARAALDGYNPQTPQYRALKKLLADARSGKTVEAVHAEPEKAPAKKEKTKKAAKSETTPEAKSKTISTDAILANMERWRWMPHDLGPTYVMVNIPDFTLKVVENGKTVWTTRIVTGKPGNHATPLLTETMKYITVNPTWNVPPSIIKNEYLPALARDPDALARIGLKVTHNSDGSVRIFQPPGERNALGRIRFNFPNRFLVYQHDTPDKNLFAHDVRAYSHGCMRVQNPDQYAEVLLGITQPDDKYSAAKIRSMYGSGERNITLKTPMPVYITYQTVFVDDAGKPQTRADIYGLDRDTLRVLRERGADTPMARNYNQSSQPARSASRTREAADFRRSYGWNGGWGSDTSYVPPDRTRIQ